MSEARKSGPPKSQPIVALTGFMAVGKSTVGRVLGALIHWSYIDLDCEIECHSHMRISDIFAMQGEKRFREMEADALRRVVEHASSPTVIALGGGTFAQEQNAKILLSHDVRVVFLELQVEELLERCRCARERAPQNPRPLADDPDAFRRLYAQRLPCYRQAELTVRTKGKAAEQVAQEIAAALHLLTSDQRHR